MASEAVVAALLAAHSGAAKETDRVRPLCRTLRATARPVLLCALSFRPPPRCAVWEATAAHRRVQPGIGGGGSGAAVGTPGRGHGEGQIGASTETPPRCAIPFACMRVLTYSLPHRVAQDGMLPLHRAASGQASEAVVLALLAAHSGAAKEKDKVRPLCPRNSPRRAA